ncbi:hypothetical protein ACIF8T_15760 [Streptomyces sp. NPDC085946]|uniref:hypothetical protein n=1 Tax=Streptomyces sp. NPDC085946 TaxID=3365744 RepID=UPI0037D34AB0
MPLPGCRPGRPGAVTGGRCSRRTSSPPAGPVRALHRALGPDARGTPAGAPPEPAAHHVEPLAEEAAEVTAVPVRGPPAKPAHEPADVVHVAYGTAPAHGSGLDEAVAGIHRSGVTEPGPDGRAGRRADGEAMEGGHHRAPDAAAVPRRQGWVPGGGGGGPPPPPGGPPPPAPAPFPQSATEASAPVTCRASCGPSPGAAGRRRIHQPASGSV